MSYYQFPKTFPIVSVRIFFFNVYISIFFEPDGRRRYFNSSENLLGIVCGTNRTKKFNKHREAQEMTTDF